MADGEQSRALLVTGPGGDGVTTVAAATALAAARAGWATLLLSPASPARLAGLLGTPPPPWPDGPADLAPGLQVARLDSAAAFRSGALSLQGHLRPALDRLGAPPLDGDELTELPGTAALALLTVLRAVHAAGTWDLVVVDLPPVPDGVQVLALPEQLRRYLRRLVPGERPATRSLPPLLAQLVGAPAFTRWLHDGAEAALAALQELVEAPGISVRLVAEPSPRSVAALRAARAGLALHGLALDTVVANRMLPSRSTDPWLAALAERQRSSLADLARLDAPHPPRHPPLCALPHRGARRGGGDDQGLASLAPLAEALAATLPPQAHRDEPVLDDLRATDGLFVWRLPLPGAAKPDLDLVRRGDELFVTAGPFRRALLLPAVLRPCSVTGAALDDSGHLAVRFAP